MGSAKLCSRDVYESEKQVQRICDNFLWLSEFVKVTICQCFQFFINQFAPKSPVQKSWTQYFFKTLYNASKMYERPLKAFSRQHFLVQKQQWKYQNNV